MWNMAVSNSATVGAIRSRSVAPNLLQDREVARYTEKSKKTCMSLLELINCFDLMARSTEEPIKLPKPV